MPKPLVIDGIRFASQSAALSHVQGILYKYQLHQRLVGQDATFVRALFDRHPERDAKMAGQDIDHFEIREQQYGTRSFVLVRADGSSDDFAINKALRGRAPERTT